MAAPVNFYLSPHPFSTFVDSSKKTDKGAGLSGREAISIQKEDSVNSKKEIAKKFCMMYDTGAKRKNPQ